MRKPEAEIVTEIILNIFRVNGLLLDAGDKLTSSLNLTSAKWQVLGAVAISVAPLTTPQIASVMGLTRQAVQKQINSMIKEDLLQLRSNSANKRSPFVALSSTGEQVYQKLDRLQAEWANNLTIGISATALNVTLETLHTLRSRLADNSKG